MAKSKVKRKKVVARRKPRRTLGMWLRSLGVCQEYQRRYGKLSLKRAIRLADRRGDWHRLWGFVPSAWTSWCYISEQEGKRKILAQFAKWRARGR